MIPKETLKKHNLKAVPFSEIREGQTFFVLFTGEKYDRCLERRLVGDIVPFTDGAFANAQCPVYADYIKDYTVYVPVWRTSK